MNVNKGGCGLKLSKPKLVICFEQVYQAKTCTSINHHVYSSKLCLLKLCFSLIPKEVGGVMYSMVWPAIVPLPIVWELQEWVYSTSTIMIL